MKNTTMKKALLVGAVALTSTLLFGDEKSEYEQARLSALTPTAYGVEAMGSDFLDDSGARKSDFETTALQQIRNETVQNSIEGASVDFGESQHVFAGQISLQSSARPEKYFEPVADTAATIDASKFNTVTTATTYRAFDEVKADTEDWAHGSFRFYLRNLDSASTGGEFDNLVLRNVVNYDERETKRDDKETYRITKMTWKALAAVNGVTPIVVNYATDRTVDVAPRKLEAKNGYISFELHSFTSQEATEMYTNAFDDRKADIKFKDEIIDGIFTDQRWIDHDAKSDNIKTDTGNILVDTGKLLKGQETMTGLMQAHFDVLGSQPALKGETVLQNEETEGVISLPAQK